MLRNEITTTNGVFNFIGEKDEALSGMDWLAFYTQIKGEFIIFPYDKIVCWQRWEEDK